MCGAGGIGSSIGSFVMSGTGMPADEVAPGAPLGKGVAACPVFGPLEEPAPWAGAPVGAFGKGAGGRAGAPVAGGFAPRGAGAAAGGGVGVGTGVCAEAPAVTRNVSEPARREAWRMGTYRWQMEGGRGKSLAAFV